MPLILPNDIVNGTNADAVPVEDNYNRIEQYINAELINRGGSVAMTSPLLLAGDPTQPLHAATKSYVDVVLPVGIVMPYGGVVAPAGGVWGLCNGQALAITEYGALYALIGDKFGVAAAGSFLLPNLNGRVAVGLDAAKAAFDTVGKSGGTWVVPVPQHNHGMAHSHPMPHTHEHPHSHQVTHDHASVDTTGVAVSADFTIAAEANATGFGTGSIARSNNGGTALNVEGTATDTPHDHAVNLPSITVTSGPASEATTGPVSTPNTSGSSAATTNNAGVLNVEHLLPYVTMTYIMRLK